MTTVAVKPAKPATMAQALTRAMRDAMAADPSVHVLGEDVGTLGGVFRVTDGLAAEFGEDRCTDTPLAEAGILGTAVGMAMYGLRPVVEMQFDAFAYPAFEQLVSHVARMRNRTRGRMPLPLTIRVPYGGGIGGVEHHSDSSEAYYIATPGLHVVTPATVADAYGLLRAAIASDDPVVVLEPKRLYWSKDSWNPEEPAPVEPIGRAVVRRPGRSATLITYGPSVPVCMDAAEAASAEGWDLEVVDLRSLVPFDDETVSASVRRTGRAVVVHESGSFAGPGAEIAARVTERCFHHLEAPVLRVAGFDIPYPPPMLERHHLPGVDRILDAVARLQWEAGELMAQVLEFKLPDLGEGLTEAEIVRWLVQVGDVVAIDQPVVEVETAKATVEVPCPYGGVVTARYGDEGTELPVGAPLLTVAVGAPASAADGAAAPAAAEGSGNVLVGYGTSEAPARRRRVRPQRLTPASPSPAAGPSAPAVPAAPSPAPAMVPAVPASAKANGHAPAAGRADGPVPVISPLVRRLARENDLDLRELTGSGPDGLILRADVESALRAAASPAPSTVTASPRTAAASAPGVTRIPLKGIRGAVADKLSRSRREIPDATCWVDADATELMRARAAMNAAGGPKISLLALLARICTAALARYPELNSTVDQEAREVVVLDRVHLGFAAQTERGLVVPVVRDAHTRDAEGLSAEFARLTEAARSGSLTPGDLTGGTFTLNNYGVFGVDGSTPIVNHPEAAMLGVGRIIPKPWVHEGELAVRQVVQLSLTFDHRVCDGGTAGGFLRHVADCVEQPAVLLRRL